MSSSSNNTKAWHSNSTVVVLLDLRHSKSNYIRIRFSRTCPVPFNSQICIFLQIARASESALIVSDSVWLESLEHHRSDSSAIWYCEGVTQVGVCQQERSAPHWSSTSPPRSSGRFTKPAQFKLRRSTIDSECFFLAITLSFARTRNCTPTHGAANTNSVFVSRPSYQEQAFGGEVPGSIEPGTCVAFGSKTGCSHSTKSESCPEKSPH